MSQNPYSRWVKLRDHAVQTALWYSAQRFRVVTSGRRSGKTELAKRFVVTKAVTERTPWETNYYFCGAPTRPQAKKIYWNDIKSLSRPWWSKPPSESELTVFLEYDGIKSEITVLGLDAPARIEGMPWNGGILDEYGNMKKDTFDANIFPALADREGWCWLIGVPEGRNHYYEKALFATGNAIPVSIPKSGGVVTSSDPEWGYYNWFSSDILSPKMIESARNLLDERTYKQEMEGQFVSYGGQLYYSFDSDCINDLVAKHNPNEALYLTCDFNKNPMAWSVAQIDYMGSKKRLKVIDDINQLNNAKTHAGALQFVKQFKEHREKVVIVTGDAANNYESHRDFTTDYMIIKSTLQKHGWQVMLKVPTHNANINNRVNIVNSLFEHGRCYINSKVKLLALDLERNESDNSGGKDKTDPMQTHASDNFDYLVWLLFASEFKILGVAQ